MGKKELFEKKFLAAIFNGVKTFPVHRGEGDLAAIRHSLKVLRSGEMLGIFPEGTRIKNQGIRAFEAGAALLALKSDTPIIPIFIKGNYKLFRRMTMIIGEPLLLRDTFDKSTNSQTVAKATKFLRDKLLQMEEETL